MITRSRTAAILTALALAQGAAPLLHPFNQLSEGLALRSFRARPRPVPGPHHQTVGFEHTLSEGCPDAGVRDAPVDVENA
jgi:hypothetical protein